MFRPLTLSREFEGARGADAIVQSFHRLSPNVAFFPFALGGVLGSELCYLPCISWPSDLARQLGRGNRASRRNMDWLAPVIGIPLLAFGGRVVFDVLAQSDNFRAGIIYGMYSCAMSILTNLPDRDDAKIISLRKVFGSFIQLPDTLKQEERTSISGQSEQISAVAFLVTSLALSYFGKLHMISANTIAYILAAATQVVSARILAAGYSERQLPV